MSQVKEEQDKESPSRKEELKVDTETAIREKLTRWVSLVSIGGVLFLTFIVIIYSWSKMDSSTMTMAFSAVLPLFGAWVGTILAFYFGRENFEAATRSVSKIAQAIGPTAKLEEIPVTRKMITKRDMMVDDRPADQIKLAGMVENFNKKENVKKQRLPILDDKGAIVYMIHRSSIDRFLAKKALKTPGDLSTLTLKDLLDEDQDLKSMFEHTFAIVKADATLADAKTVMDSIPKCQDVFITESGNITDPVIGWITNVIIQDAAML